MQLELTVVTALAVMVHLGTTVAGAFLKDQTDQAKIAALSSKVDQVLGVVTAIAPAVNALPTTAPKTVSDVAADLAAVAQALAAATSIPASNPTKG